MSLKDDLIKHQIFLQRLGANHAVDLRLTLQKGVTLAIQALKNYPQGLTKQQIRKLHSDIIEVYHGIKDSQIGLLVETAVYEAGFLARRLVANNVLESAKVPNKEDLRSAVSNNKMSIVSGEKKVVIPNALTHFANTKASEVVLIVGDASLEAKEEIEEKGTNKLLAIAAGLFATQALTLSTTITTQAASSARQEVYTENSIPLLDWVTELDSDVCEDCEALGANGPYPADDVDIPPEHWNCRCVLVPVNE